MGTKKIKNASKKLNLAKVPKPKYIMIDGIVYTAEQFKKLVSEELNHGR